MRNRPAFDMRMFTVVHNVFMFSASLYMLIETLTQVSSPSANIHQSLYASLLEVDSRHVTFELCRTPCTSMSEHCRHLPALAGFGREVVGCGATWLRLPASLSARLQPSLHACCGYTTFPRCTSCCSMPVQRHRICLDGPLGYRCCLMTHPLACTCHCAIMQSPHGVPHKSCWLRHLIGGCRPTSSPTRSS